MGQLQGFRLSPQQKRLWLSFPEGSLLRAVLQIEVEGDLDPAALHRGLGLLAGRHEILRTGFQRLPGIKLPVQVVESEAEVRWREAGEADLDRLWRETAAPKPSEARPEIDAALVDLGADRWTLVLGLSALAADPMGLASLFREVGEAYVAALAGRSLPEPDVQYLQFSEWQNAVAEEMATVAPRPSPAWETRLPYERATNAASAGRVRRVDGSAAGPLRELAQAREIALDAVLLATWQALLWRLTAGGGGAVTTLVPGRGPEELRHTPGLFASAVAVPARISPTLGFWDLVGRARAAVEETETAVLADATPASGVPAGFELAGEEPPQSAGGVVWRLLDHSAPVAGAPLLLRCRCGATALEVELIYPPERMSEVAAACLADQFLALLRSAIESPDAPVDRLSFLTEAERRELVEGFNATEAEALRRRCAHPLIEEQVDLGPARTAVNAGDERLSYAELEARANRVAHRLLRLGVQPEDRVAVLLERSPDLAVALLGVLKAGGCYVPLDPADPEERLAWLLQDARPVAALTTPELAPRLGSCPAERVLLGSEALADEPGRRPAVDVLPDNAAYVIYTSGSTGRPKGVLVPHRGLANYLVWCRGAYPLGDGLAAPHHSSAGFDLSVTALLGPLVAGGRVEMIPAAAGGDALAEALGAGGFGLVKLTPSHLGVLDGLLGPERKAGMARTLVLGGEALPAGSLVAWRVADPEVRIVNEYGPTEAVVGCCVHEVPLGDELAGPVPIGRPIANARLYALDESGEPVPSGVPGELHIGGECVARGYLGRPDLTAERFVPDAFAAEPGGRLYRTGDLARHLPGVGLEYLGRNDEQVKIRGVRIEPAEVESALASHPQVREAAVAAVEDAQGHRRLVAWVVPAGEASPTGTDLRLHLEERLPSALVPSLFVPLRNLPRSPSGKLDRRSLPRPGQLQLDGDRAYEVPRTAAERALAAIWSQVLGVERVGLRDGFFELGGDSILSTQVVFKARQAGLKITARQMFQYQTLADLAEAAVLARPEPGEEGASGVSFPLTPIQRWFFALRVPHRAHWNQSLWLDCRTRLAPAGLDRGVRLLLAHHEALRLRFERDGAGWTQSVAPTDAAAGAAVVDFSALPDERQAEALGAAAAALQRSLDLAAGPLARVVLAERGPERSQRLLVVVHHLAVDGVSWRILLEDLLAWCRAEDAPAPRTTSLERWAKSLAEWGRSPEAREELGFWLEQALPERLPRDSDEGPGLEGTARTVTRELEAEWTRELLQVGASAARTTAEEVMIAALARALRRWTGGSRALVELEGHGREPLFDDVDLSRTVGWFTTLYPLRLELSERAAAAEDLRTVQAQLRRVPHRGIGYGVLRYLGEEEEARSLAALPRPEISFNYLGQWDQALPGGLALAREPMGPARDPEGERSHPLTVVAGVLGGRLMTAWTFDEALHRRDTVERLAQGFLEEVQLLLRAEERPGVAAAAEASYELSPMQQGMLFTTLYREGAGTYVEQAAYGIAGELDPTALEEAWRYAVERHEVLRTGFLWEGREEPLQVVFRSAGLRIEHHDWRGLKPDEREESLAELLREDRLRPFDLARPPLMRLTVLRLEDRFHRLIWTHHHLILDGWSVARLLDEVLRIYVAVCTGHEPELDPPPSYRAYIEWLRGQDREEAACYWRETLSGVVSGTGLPLERGGVRDAGAAGPPLEVRIELGEETAGALRAAARRCGVTLNTLVQGALGVLLSRATRRDDVVFGFTVSGRPEDLPEADRGIGLYINTVPLRLRPSPESTVREYLRDVLDRGAGAQRHGYLPLGRVQRWTGVPHGVPLFEALLVFENYPLPSGDRSGLDLEVRDFQLLERTEYPLVVLAIPGRGLSLAAVHDPRRLEPAAARRLLGHLRNLLVAMAAGLDRRLDDLSLLSDEEIQLLVCEQAGRAYEMGEEKEEETLHSLFFLQAERTPRAVAVQCGDASLTYAELAARADALARILRRRGIGPDAAVAVLLDRSLDLAVALVGILKAGGAYLPLDPDYPAERIAFMLEDGGVRLVVTRSDLAGRLPEGSARAVFVDEPAAAAGSPLADPETGPENLAYILYTSGSTGRPKGVLVEHRNVTRLFRATEPLFGFGAGDVWTLFHSYTFDFSVWELWGALLYGGRLVVVPYLVSRSPESFHRLLQDERVTVLNQTPSAFRQLVQADAEKGGDLALRLVIFGGEALNLQSLRPWYERHGDCEPLLVNMYGITETTVHVTWRPLFASDVEEGRGSVIGRPLADLRTYVLDPAGQPAPMGAPGEIHVGGAGVSRGYLSRPELAAERFVPDPFSRRPGERLYRTGDLARWLDGGELEYLGRIDDQVKVRGFRIELGEIEAALHRHPAVREAVVLAIPEEHGGNRLVAWAAADGVASEALRASLRDQLPDYMVPSSVVLVAALPLTPHGKLDRAALPSPDGEPPAGGRSPRTPVEEGLVEIWRDVLGREPDGIDADFFELGGHSLLATQLVSRVRRFFRVDLPLGAVFEARALHAMAGEIDRALRRDAGFEAPPLRPLPRNGRAPVSFAQERLWFLDRMSPGGAAFNVNAALEVQGALDLPRLARTLSTLTARHEVLRTTFEEVDGEPVQVIGGPAEVDLLLVDLRGLPARTRRDEARAVAQRLSELGFDLQRGPLMRAAVLRLAPQESVLVLTLHHIVADGWSLGVLVREVVALYSAVDDECLALPAPVVQYADYAAWQRDWLRGPVLDAQLDYWRDRLKGRLPHLELPVRRRRGAAQGTRGATCPIALPADLVARLRTLGRSEDATLFMTLLGAFKVLLFRYTGETDLCVGTPVAGRNRLDIEGLIGFFLNTLVTRVDLDGDPTFRELLGRVRSAVLEAYAHQDLPYDQLVRELGGERDVARPDLFQVMFLLHNFRVPEIELPGLAVRPFPLQRRTTHTELALEIEERGGGAVGLFAYNTDLFGRSTIERLAGHYLALLESVAGAPDAPISTLALEAEEQPATVGFTRNLDVW